MKTGGSDYPSRLLLCSTWSRQLSFSVTALTIFHCDEVKEVSDSFPPLLFRGGKISCTVIQLAAGFRLRSRPACGAIHRGLGFPQQADAGRKRVCAPVCLACKQFETQKYDILSLHFKFGLTLT